MASAAPAELALSCRVYMNVVIYVPRLAFPLSDQLLANFSPVMPCRNKQQHRGCRDILAWCEIVSPSAAGLPDDGGSRRNTVRHLRYIREGKGGQNGIDPVGSIIIITITIELNCDIFKLMAKVGYRRRLAIRPELQTVGSTDRRPFH